MDLEPIHYDPNQPTQATTNSQEMPCVEIVEEKKQGGVGVLSCLGLSCLVKSRPSNPEPIISSRSCDECCFRSRVGEMCVLLSLRGKFLV